MNNKENKTAQDTGQHNFSFLVRKKRKFKPSGGAEVLLNKILKKNVSFEAFCRIENHDDYNDAIRRRMVLQQVILAVVCILIAFFGRSYLTFDKPYFEWLSIPVAAVIYFIVNENVLPYVNRNVKHAVPSLVLWDLVYESQKNSAFREVFKQRLFSSDVLFLEDLDFLRSVQQKLFEENELNKQDYSMEEKIL